MSENETEEGTQTEVTADECYKVLTNIVAWLKILDEKISAISTKIG